MAEGAHTRQKKSRTPALVAIGAVLVVAAVIVGIVLFSGGGNQTNASPGSTQVDPETPEFDFEAAKAVAIPTNPEQQPKKLAGVAASASKEAVRTLDAIYTEGYLDPSSWDGANYDEAWAQFTDEAAAGAERDVDTLTAGATAGDRFDTIEPVKGTVKARVLTDPNGHPLSVVAIVYFSAKGVHEDGSYTLFKSTGQFFLQKGGSGWKVISFEVARKDAQKEAPPTSTGAPSGTGAPSESESPS